MGLSFGIRHGGTPRGRLWNMLEAFLVYLRDFVAVPSIGSHDARRFGPLVWTVFFFVLGCNLMGMLPWAGSPTASFAVTAALAFVIFLTVIGSGMARLGVWGFWKAQVPHMDLPKPVAILLIPMIFVIEIFGLLVKHFVLAVRLLANMIGGHVVLAVLLAFISATASSLMFWGVMPASVLGATCAEPARIAGGLYSSVHFRVFDRTVYRHGRSSALVAERLPDGRCRFYDYIRLVILRFH